MELFHRIIVTSSKGGIGKSSTALGMAAALSDSGHRVLLVDCDAGNRCLDIMMGIQDQVLYDLSDLTSHRISPDEALLHHPAYENLYFCAAPYRMPEQLDETEFIGALRALQEAANAEFVICDTSGSGAIVRSIAGKFADCAWIVATQQPTSIRSAEKTAAWMDECGKLPCRLVISCFEEKSAQKGTRSGLLEMIDRTCVQAIGVVPYDRKWMLAQEKGQLPPPDSRAWIAYRNTARRLCGENVPLFTGMRRIRTNRIL